MWGSGEEGREHWEASERITVQKMAVHLARPGLKAHNARSCIVRGQILDLSLVDSGQTL
jgi:hypothetical protein